MTYKFKIGERVALSCDVALVPNIMPSFALTKGMTGTIHNAVHSNLGIYAVRFDADGPIVLIGDNQMVHAPDELAAMRARLETREQELFQARDALHRLEKQRAADIAVLTEQIDAYREQQRKFAELLGYADPDKWRT